MRHFARTELLLSSTYDNRVFTMYVYAAHLVFNISDTDSNLPTSIRRSREEAKERARAHKRAGNTAAANECYQRAVDITPEMAKVVVDRLKFAGFECIVAPYEADGQMAYLVRHGFVDGVITEDSDLVAHQCKSVFYKMDSEGIGQEIRYADIVRNKDLSFVGFTPDQFLEMCVMSGCDYLPSLSGVGIKKAHGLMRRFKSYSKALRNLRFDGTHVPRTYESEFQDALSTFRHQWVYCPSRMEIVHLSDSPCRGDGPDTGGIGVGAEEVLPCDIERLIGPHIPREAGQGVAEGNLHPFTLEPFEGLKNSRVGVTGGGDGGGEGFIHKGGGVGGATPWSLSQRHRRESRDLSSVGAAAHTPSVSKFFKPIEARGMETRDKQPSQDASAFDRFLHGTRGGLVSSFGGDGTLGTWGREPSSADPQPSAEVKPHWPTPPSRAMSGHKRAFYNLLRQSPAAGKTVGAMAGTPGAGAGLGGGGDNVEDGEEDKDTDAQDGQEPIECLGAGKSYEKEGEEGEEEEDLLSPVRPHPMAWRMPKGGAASDAGVYSSFKPPRKQMHGGQPLPRRSPYFKFNTTTPVPAEASLPRRDEDRDTPFAASQDAAGATDATATPAPFRAPGGVARRSQPSTAPRPHQGRERELEPEPKLELDVGDAGGRGERLCTDVRHCAAYGAIAKFALDNVMSSAATSAGDPGGASSGRDPANARPLPAGQLGGIAKRGRSVLVDLQSFRCSVSPRGGPQALAEDVRDVKDDRGWDKGGVKHMIVSEAAVGSGAMGDRGVKRRGIPPPERSKRTPGIGGLFENFRSRT